MAAPVVCGLFAALWVLGCGPELSLNTAGLVLVVGERAVVNVTSGDDDEAQLVSKTFKLTDATGAVYEPHANNPDLRIAVSVPSSSKSISALEFTVPTGIAPGEATLSVATRSGEAFSGKVQVRRLAAVRDLAGKVWMVALTGSGEAQVARVMEKDELGSGFGRLSVSPDGVMLVSSAFSDKDRVWAGWMEAGRSAGYPYGDLLANVNDLVVAYGGTTLLATDSGVYTMPRPQNLGGQLNPSANTALAVKAFRVVGARRSGTAVVLAENPAALGTYRAVQLQPANASAKTTDTLDLTTWKVKVNAHPALAMSHDGKLTVLASPTEGEVRVMVSGSTTALSKTLPTTEKEPVAVAAAPSGDKFYLLNKATNNISVVTVSDGKVALGTPIALPSEVSSAGAAVDLQMSDHGELVALYRKGMFLINTTTATATKLTPGALFQGGEEAGSMALQP